MWRDGRGETGHAAEGAGAHLGDRFGRDCALILLHQEIAQSDLRAERGFQLMTDDRQNLPVDHRLFMRLRDGFSQLAFIAMAGNREANRTINEFAGERELVDIVVNARKERIPVKVAVRHACKQNNREGRLPPAQFAHEIEAGHAGGETVVNEGGVEILRKDRFSRFINGRSPRQPIDRRTERFEMPDENVVVELVVLKNQYI